MAAFTGKDLDALLKRRQLSVSGAARGIGAHRNTLSRYIDENEEVPLTIRLALAAWLADVPPISRTPRAKKSD